MFSYYKRNRVSSSDSNFFLKQIGKVVDDDLSEQGIIFHNLYFQNIKTIA
jgi:hypothetical protein